MFLKKLFKSKTIKNLSSDNYNVPEHNTAPQNQILQTEELSSGVTKNTYSNGSTSISISIPELENGFPRYYAIKETGIVYDLGTVSGIAAIKESPYQHVDITNYDWSIEYILQRKATEYKRNGCLDLAIACLRKSNSIMELRLDYWTKKDFLRLPEFLRQAKDFDGARKEENYINTILFPPKTNNDVNITQAFLDFVKLCSDKGTDLAVSEYKTFCSAECSKYRARIYSVSGNDKRFPKLPKTLFEFNLGIRPFFEEFSKLHLPEYIVADPIEYSNRPFEDSRTEYEARVYTESIEKAKAEKKDREDYNWIRENLGDIAPKSFGGYRNMKHKNSANYQNIIKEAAKRNYII
ncbi:putative uncharacterized protein [Firmicutes bacterium CAG:646]|nr:putative uncharacterized protein [Firmicutes bacterium CAG:646]